MSQVIQGTASYFPSLNNNLPWLSCCIWFSFDYFS